MTTPDNNDDVIDSRAVIKRLAELESERSDLDDAVEDAKAALAETTVGDEATAANDVLIKAQEALDEWDADNRDELKALKELDEQASGYAGDWRHGATLIRDSYFKRYAEQYAEDMGLIQANASWPYTCIDWEKAADELQVDYTSVEFDGVTYWVR